MDEGRSGGTAWVQLNAGHPNGISSLVQWNPIEVFEVELRSSGIGEMLDWSSFMTKWDLFFAIGEMLIVDMARCVFFAIAYGY